MILSRDDFGILAVCAIRYCHGRQTYIPDLVRGIVSQHLGEISDKDLSVMIDDCEFQRKMDLYGDGKIDMPGQIRWEHAIKAERDRREAKATDHRK